MNSELMSAVASSFFDSPEVPQQYVPLFGDQQTMHKNQTDAKLASEKQVGGDHYRSKSIQPWTAMEAWMSPEQFEGYLRGNVIKYIARYTEKGGVQDLYKTKHYLERLLEHLENGK